LVSRLAIFQNSRFSPFPPAPSKLLVEDFSKRHPTPRRAGFQGEDLARLQAERTDATGARAEEMRAYCSAGESAMFIRLRQRRQPLIIRRRLARPATQPVVFSFRQKDESLTFNFDSLWSGHGVNSPV
jgi:hypothetical protein